MRRFLRERERERERVETTMKKMNESSAHFFLLFPAIEIKELYV